MSMNEIVFDSNPKLMEQQKEILASSAAFFTEGVMHLMEGNAEFDLSFLKKGFLKDITSTETLVLLTAICNYTISPQLQNRKSDRIALDKHPIVRYVQLCILAEMLVYYKDNVLCLKDDAERQLKETLISNLAVKIDELSITIDREYMEKSYEEFWERCNTIIKAQQRKNEKKKIGGWFSRFF